MALTWSMDKLGPICRSAMDASLVFAKIHGADGKDPTAVDLPFTLPVNVKVKGWKIGYFEAAMRGRGGQSYEKVLEELEEMGLELVPLELPDYPVNAMRIILSAEAATAFDELTRTAADDKLVRQGAGAWPNLFRVARLIPAVEYLRANRMRSLLMKDMDRVMAKVDLIVHPNFFGSILLLTNLTGHPTAVVPCGAPRRGRAPGSLSFTGQLFGESRLLAVVQAWQAKTGYHRVHPAEF